MNREYHRALERVDVARHDALESRRTSCETTIACRRTRAVVRRDRPCPSSGVEMVGADASSGPGRSAKEPSGYARACFCAGRRPSGRPKRSIMPSLKPWGRRPPPPSSRRLEDHHRRAVEIARLGEILAAPSRIRGVAVVPAGVHLAPASWRRGGQAVISWIGRASNVGADPDSRAPPSDRVGPLMTATIARCGPCPPPPSSQPNFRHFWGDDAAVRCNVP